MTTRREVAAWATVGLVVAASWAAFATSVVSPVVVADEVLFQLTAVAGPRLAQAQAMGAAVQPSGALAYPWLVHLAAGSGLKPEAAAKLLNAALFTAAATWLAVKSRALAEARPSRLVVATLLLAPVATYTAYVMPEALYFALMAAAAAALMGGPADDDRADASGVATAGALLGAAVLVKPHAVLAVAALIAALAARALLRRRWRRGGVELLCALGAAGLAYAAVKALTTPPGLSGRDLLGPEYRAQLAALAAGPAQLAAGLRLAADYAAAVLALAAPMVVVLAAAVLDRAPGAWVGPQGRARLAGLWALGLLAALVVAVPLVLATEADKVHLRYLDFLFPVLLAIAARLGPRPSTAVLRVAAAVWAASAVFLAWELRRLHPLAAAAPDLFFLYDGQGFGRFGLGFAARPFLLVVVGAAALAMLSGRVSWLHAQAAALLVFTVVAIPNAWLFDRRLSSDMAADRAVGRVAVDACGRGPRDVTALGTPTDFVPLYAALARFGRPAPLVLSKTPEAERARLPAGACLLTTLPAPEPRWAPLAQSAALRLVRAR